MLDVRIIHEITDKEDVEEIIYYSQHEGINHFLVIKGDEQEVLQYTVSTEVPEIDMMPIAHKLGYLKYMKIDGTDIRFNYLNTNYIIPMDKLHPMEVIYNFLLKQGMVKRLRDAGL